MADSRGLFKPSWRVALHLFFKYIASSTTNNLPGRNAQSCLLSLQNDLSAKKISHRAVTEQ